LEAVPDASIPQLAKLEETDTEKEHEVGILGRLTVKYRESDRSIQ